MLSGIETFICKTSKKPGDPCLVPGFVLFCISVGKRIRDELHNDRIQIVFVSTRRIMLWIRFPSSR